MKLSYDKDVDILRVLLNDKPIQESDEVSDLVIFDYDSADNPVGFEILVRSATREVTPTTRGRIRRLTTLPPARPQTHP